MLEPESQWPRWQVLLLFGVPAHSLQVDEASLSQELSLESIKRLPLSGLRVHEIKIPLAQSLGHPPVLLGRLRFQKRHLKPLLVLAR